MMKCEQMLMTKQVKSGLGSAFVLKNVNIHSVLISLFFFFFGFVSVCQNSY